MAVRIKRNIQAPLRDCDYPTTTTPQSSAQSASDKKFLSSTNIGQSNSSVKSAKMFVNFNKMFENGPPTEEECCSYTTLHPTLLQQHRTRSRVEGECKEDGVSTNGDYNDYLYRQLSRLPGGAHHHAADKLILSPSQCKVQPAGLNFFDLKSQVNVINLQLNDVSRKGSVDGLKLSQGRSSVVKKKTRATQTLFRESSAQTLPYLPGVSNNVADLEDLEIFHLPTILPENGSPGLYEVEVLERARKRWNFLKALKENFRKQLQAAKEQAKLQEHEDILEAFEWEHWIEREENIQECQMLRLELLIGMFDERERKMHMASKARIEKSYDDIEAKRKAALKKNEIEYKRSMRRLEIKHKKQPRVWRKEHITQELGDPSSEFNAPKMRYGVNPNRRHFTVSRSGFDLRMDNLEKKAIQMDPKNLRCPFAKLRQWSKPKEILQEVEQNFCSDANLNRLYDSLRTLRETSKRQKYIPLCLKVKQPTTSDDLEDSAELPEALTKAGTGKQQDEVAVSELSISDKIEKNQSLEQLEIRSSFEELRRQKQAERLNMEKLQKEMRCEELETLISSFQGNTIGWLMRFLTEEMYRLKEQRKLQFLTMLAKRKRWRRESAEAGLRQKENCMRETYEKIYKECNEINRETTNKFLDSILKTDIEDYARQKAEQGIVVIAKDLDEEISSWLKSFEEVQNPLNYQTLRQALKDIVMPDEEQILYRLERDECVDYVINDVLLNKVYNDLESYDISFSLASDLVDRLIDNDLYLNSPDLSSDCEYSSPCACFGAQQEANAIIRKIIRRATPGRRWFTEEERIAEEILCDLLDDVFDRVIKENGIIEIDMTSKPRTSCRGAHTDLISYNKNFNLDDFLETPQLAECQGKVEFKFLNSESKICAEDITKSLKWSEKLLLTDPDKLPNDEFVLKKDEYVLPEPKPKLSVLHTIPSYHDLPKMETFRKTPIFAQTSSEEMLERMRLEQVEEIDEESFLLIEGSIKELGFLEQLESEEQFVEEQQEQEEQGEQEVEIEKSYFKEIYDEELKLSVSIEKTKRFDDLAKESTQAATIQRISKQAVTQGSFEKPAVQINTKPVTELHDDEAAEEEEDNTSGFMRVSFTYDPQLNFSVAIPTNQDDDESGQDTFK